MMQFITTFIIFDVYFSFRPFKINSLFCIRARTCIYDIGKNTDSSFHWVILCFSFRAPAYKNDLPRIQNRESILNGLSPAQSRTSLSLLFIILIGMLLFAWRKHTPLAHLPRYFNCPLHFSSRASPSFKSLYDTFFDQVAMQRCQYPEL